MSQNRYSAIKKIRKEELRKIEKRLMALESKSRHLQEKIEGLKDALLQSELPKEGEIGHLQSGADLRAIRRRHIDELINELKQLRKELENEKSAYQEANIEYEKIAYLYQELEKKKQIVKSKEEAKLLDEIAVILHSQVKEKIE